MRRAWRAGLQLFLYSRVLKGHDVGSYDERFKRVFPKIALSTCAMAIVMAACGYVLRDWFHGDTLHKLVAVAILCGLAGLTYAVCVLKSGVLDINEIKALLKKRKEKPDPAAPLPPDV